MIQMTQEQVANFTYWVTEDRTHRGAIRHSGQDRVEYIKTTLVPEFFRKYPNGVLTGWTRE